MEEWLLSYQTKLAKRIVLRQSHSEIETYYIRALGIMQYNVTTLRSCLHYKYQQLHRQRPDMHIIP